MQGPGNDIESITGMVASGANIICFSTGKGSVTGSAIVPVVKISSTSELHHRMPGDIDFDAGKLLDTYNSVTLEEISDTLMDLVIAVASGQKTKSEQNQQRQFQIWTAGKLSL
jgi:altronate dehydratase